MTPEIGMIVDTDDGFRQVVFIDRDKRIARLSLIPFAVPERIEDDPRFNGPDVPWDQLRRVSYARMVDLRKELVG